MNAWLVVSTRLKNISQIGSFPHARRLIANSKIGASKRFPSAFEAQYFGALYMLHGQKNANLKWRHFRRSALVHSCALSPRQAGKRTSWKKCCAS